MTNEPHGCLDPRIPDEPAPDELTLRIRSLEAERVRPVPPPPVMRKRATTDAERWAAKQDAGDLFLLEQQLAETASRRAVLQKLGRKEEPE